MRSEAQKQASRENGKKSKGPTTPEGKEITKFNGLKHGLRSEHVILPGEDPDEFAAERAGWIGDWRPVSHTRAVLVERAALTSWRLRRAARAEKEELLERIDEAGRTFDDQRAARIARAADRFADDPGAAVSLLSCCAGGIDWLIAAWRRLGDALKCGPAGWRDPGGHTRLLNLLGRPKGTGSYEVRAEFREQVSASSRLIAVNGGDPLTRPLAKGEGEALVAGLRRLVASRLRELRADRRAAEDPAEARARAVAAASAEVFGFGSKRAQLRDRYEMAHDRALRSIIGKLMALSRSGDDLGGGSEAAAAPARPSAPRAKAVVAAATLPIVNPGLSTNLPAPPPSTVAPAPGSVGAGESAAPAVSVAATDRPSKPSPRPRRRGGRGRSRK